MRESVKWTAAALGLALISGCVSSSVEKRDPKSYLKERAEKPMDLRKKVAVADFLDKSEYGRERTGAAAADILNTALVESEQFKVFERERLSRVIDEQKLGQSGAVDPTTAAKAGQLIGVDYVLCGTVSNVSFHVETFNVVFVQKKKQIAEVVVDVRMVDATTGQIIFAKQGDGRADTEVTRSLGLGGGSSYNQSLLGEALRAAIFQMLDEMIDKAERTGR
ncbi:MAG TPA: CsgG/HfaB family protein [Planctomycetota bacterium]|jgi:curli biogenesis system outer membrane secretion channel CsgG